MAKCGTNTEVIKAYFSGDSEPYRNNSDTLYFTRNVLYSYGNHFPLAVDLGDCYMLNGDRYSITTSQHQSLAHSYVRDNKANKPYFTTSISAINNAQESVLGFHEPNFSELKVLDKIDDLYKYGKDAVDFLNSGFDLFGITIRYEKNPMTSKKEMAFIHRPGAVLFKIGKTYWLAGMDDDSYFVSRLCKRVKTVKEAFESLKPKKVKYIENTGINVKRQGEWFFIPLKMEKKEWNLISSSHEKMCGQTHMQQQEDLLEEIKYL